MDSISILLVEPDRLMREGLRVLLQNHKFQVLREAEDLRSAISGLKANPDIDLILLELPPSHNEAVLGLADLHSAAPSARTVVLTTCTDTALLTAVINAGVNGLLLKDISAEALIRSIHLAMLDEHVFAVHKKLLRPPDCDKARPEDAAQQTLSSLSAREKNILRYLTSGESNKFIARELSLTEATVKAHVKVIMRKISVQNRTQAAVWGIANGLARSPRAQNGNGHSASI